MGSDLATAAAEDRAGQQPNAVYLDSAKATDAAVGYHGPAKSFEQATEHAAPSHSGGAVPEHAVEKVAKPAEALRADRMIELHHHEN